MTGEQLDRLRELLVTLSETYAEVIDLIQQMKEENDMAWYECDDCGYVWEVPEGQPAPTSCANPECDSEKIPHLHDYDPKIRP
jgi:rubrerythrin